MSRKIDWNINHKNADEQQSEFVDNFLRWSPNKKWDYLMEICSQGNRKVNKKSERKIEWK